MYRGKLELIIDVLEACRKEGSTTSVMNAGRLNMTQFKSLVNLLQREGYVECHTAKPKTSPCRRKRIPFDRVRYRLTEKGIFLLKASAPLLALKQKLYPSKSTFRVVAVNGI